MTLQFFGNDGFSVIITFCMFGQFLLRSSLWQCLSERDRWPTFRSQLRDQLPSRGYIILCLKRLIVVTWLARLAKHKTILTRNSENLNSTPSILGGSVITIRLSLQLYA